MKSPPPDPAAVRAGLHRYIDEYHWPWSLTVQIINRNYGTSHTEESLRQLYVQK